MSLNRKGALITAVVAGLLATQSYAADTNTIPATATVKCMGVNNCKSMGACKAGASSSCGTKNACRSLNPKNIVTNLTAKECEEHGGSVVK